MHVCLHHVVPLRVYNVGREQRSLSRAVARKKRRLDRSTYLTVTVLDCMQARTHTQVFEPPYLCTSSCWVRPGSCRPTRPQSHRQAGRRDEVCAGRDVEAGAYGSASLGGREKGMGRRFSCCAATAVDRTPMTVVDRTFSTKGTSEVVREQPWYWAETFARLR